MGLVPCGRRPAGRIHLCTPQTTLIQIINEAALSLTMPVFDTASSSLHAVRGLFL